jgi:hypothetical protein
MLAGVGVFPQADGRRSGPGDAPLDDRVVAAFEGRS